MSRTAHGGRPRRADHEYMNERGLHLDRRRPGGHLARGLGGAGVAELEAYLAKHARLPRRLLDPSRMRRCAAGPRWAARCGVLSRARITADTNAPCVLASAPPIAPRQRGPILKRVPAPDRRAPYDPHRIVERSCRGPVRASSGGRRPLERPAPSVLPPLGVRRAHPRGPRVLRRRIPTCGDRTRGTRGVCLRTGSRGGGGRARRAVGRLRARARGRPRPRAARRDECLRRRVERKPGSRAPQPCSRSSRRNPRSPGRSSRA